MQAGVYASVLHYLKAVDKTGGANDGKAVVAAMKRCRLTIIPCICFR
jgi:branched-chain amino acid transport system substrate-binding protein